MNVWQLMEMIHSRSYTYIIKNVYPDPSEVFDTILGDEKILARATSVTSSYDALINHAHEYDSGNIWRMAAEGHPSGAYDRKELKRKLYRAVLNVNILEGIRFYVSFACSFAFGELRLWKDPLRLSLLSPEMKANILSLLNRSSKPGKMVTMKKWWSSLQKKNPTS